MLLTGGQSLQFEWSSILALGDQTGLAVDPDPLVQELTVDIVQQQADTVGKIGQYLQLFGRILHIEAHHPLRRRIETVQGRCIERMSFRLVEETDFLQPRPLGIQLLHACLEIVRAQGRRRGGQEAFRKGLIQPLGLLTIAGHGVIDLGTQIVRVFQHPMDVAGSSWITARVIHTQAQQLLCLDQMSGDTVT